MGVFIFVLEGFIYLIIIDAILSWFQAPTALPRKITSSLTSMMYAPIHRVIQPQKTGGIDFSPLVWIFGIQFIIGFLSTI